MWGRPSASSCSDVYPPTSPRASTNSICQVGSAQQADGSPSWQSVHGPVPGPGRPAPAQVPTSPSHVSPASTMPLPQTGSPLVVSVAAALPSCVVESGSEAAELELPIVVEVSVVASDVDSDVLPVPAPLSLGSDPPRHARTDARTTKGCQRTPQATTRSSAADVKELSKMETSTPAGAPIDAEVSLS